MQGSAKALRTYVGHASITITFDLCGKLMPRDEEEAARPLFGIGRQEAMILTGTAAQRG